MKIQSLYSRPEDDPKKRKNPDAVRPAPSPLGLAALSAGGGGSSGTSVTINSTDTFIPYRSAANTFADSPLVRSTANIMEQRNGTNAQTFRVYNSYTDASNYSRSFIANGRTFANVLDIGSEGLGTGASTITGLSLIAGGADRLNYNVSTGSSWNMLGNLVFRTDNTYDIGASGANRPRNLYLGGGAVVAGQVQASSTVSTGASTYFLWTGRSALSSAADGQILLSNNAVTDFSRLQFGGTSASFGAIGRDGAGIQIVGADGTSVSWIKVPGVTVASLPAAATAGAGARSFVTDASGPTFGATVTGGGAVASPVYSDGSNWKVG